MSQMDRKLTRKEKLRAKSRRMVVSTILLVFILTFPIFLTNHTQIVEGIDKVRTVIAEIVNVTAFVIDTIMT